MQQSKQQPKFHPKSIFGTARQCQSDLEEVKMSKPEILMTAPRTMASQNGRGTQQRQEAKLEDVEEALGKISEIMNET